MPSRKPKKVTEMTTEELARHVFPKKVVDELKRVAHEHDAEENSEPEQSSQKEA